MAIWVCRAGKKAVYVEEFLKQEKIFCTWDGFDYDLNLYDDKEKLKEKIRKEKKDAEPTAINTWAAQLMCLKEKMQNGDIVLTPNENSKSYNIGIITGVYEYKLEAPEHFRHGRQVRWLPDIIFRDKMPQYMIYSLGAYRTIFNLKYENEFVELLAKLGIPI